MRRLELELSKLNSMMSEKQLKRPSKRHFNFSLSLSLALTTRIRICLCASPPTAAAAAYSFNARLYSRLFLLLLLSDLSILTLLLFYYAIAAAAARVAQVNQEPSASWARWIDRIWSKLKRFSSPSEWEKIARLLLRQKARHSTCISRSLLFLSFSIALVAFYCTGCRTKNSYFQHEYSFIRLCALVCSSTVCALCSWKEARTKLVLCVSLSSIAQFLANCWQTTTTTTTY